METLIKRWKKYLFASQVRLDDDEILDIIYERAVKSHMAEGYRAVEQNFYDRIERICLNDDGDDIGY